MKLEPLPHQVKRFKELQQQLSEKQKFDSTDDYLNHLYEIQYNCTIALSMRACIGTTKDSGAFLNILDKVHWLIDSAEKKAAPDRSADDYTVHIHFTPAEKDDTDE